MDCFIENEPSFSTLRMNLKKNETCRAEPLAIMAMSGGIEQHTKSAGKGLFNTIKAAVGGEMISTVELNATNSTEEIILAPPLEGEIIEFNIKDTFLFVQYGTFLASDSEIQLQSEGSLRAMMSGTGLFLQRVEGRGKLFLTAYGSIIKKELSENEEYSVHNGHLLAFESSLQYTTENTSNAFFNNVKTEEDILCRFTGPGTLYMQTRNIFAFAGVLQRLVGKQH